MTTDPTAQRIAGFFFAMFLALAYFWWRDQSDPIIPFAAVAALVLCAVWLAP